MDTMFFILGGVFSWALISVIRFIKQNLKHNHEKQSIVNRIRDDDSLAQYYGDVDSFLNDSFEFRKSNFINELALNGLRPLIVLGFAFLFNGSNPITAILLFLILIFFCMHEFLYAEQLKDNNWYRSAIVVMWIVFSCNILYNNSTNETESNNDPNISIEEQNAKNHREMTKDSIE